MHITKERCSLEFKTEDEKDQGQEASWTRTGQGDLRPVVVASEESRGLDGISTFSLSMENFPEVTHSTA